MEAMRQAMGSVKTKKDGRSTTKVLRIGRKPTPLLIKSSTRRRISRVMRMNVSAPRLCANGTPSSCRMYRSIVRTRSRGLPATVILEGRKQCKRPTGAYLTPVKGYDRCSPRLVGRRGIRGKYYTQGVLSDDRACRKGGRCEE